LAKTAKRATSRKPAPARKTSGAKSRPKPADAKAPRTPKPAPKASAKETAKKSAAPKVEKVTSAKSAAAAASKKAAPASKAAAPASKKAATKRDAKADAAKKSKAGAKKVAPPKPPRPPRRNRPKSGLQAAFEAALAVSDEPKRAATKLKPGELDEFRTMLLVKRAQLLGDVEQLTDEAHAGNRTDASGDLSSMPIHMADIGSDNWDQEFNLVLLQNERNLLREIDDALERIKDGSYGICLATGRPISKARLRAKPWAKYCIEYARKKEIGHG
jgi:RNA polymerase-binding protein DksA